MVDPNRPTRPQSSDPNRPEASGRCRLSLLHGCTCARSRRRSEPTVMRFSSAVRLRYPEDPRPRVRRRWPRFIDAQCITPYRAKRGESHHRRASGSPPLCFVGPIFQCRHLFEVRKGGIDDGQCRIDRALCPDVRRILAREAAGCQTASPVRGESVRVAFFSATRRNSAPRGMNRAAQSSRRRDARPRAARLSRCRSDEGPGPRPLVTICQAGKSRTAREGAGVGDGGGRARFVVVIGLRRTGPEFAHGRVALVMSERR
jgi:hypothetical protein